MKNQLLQAASVAAVLASAGVKPLFTFEHEHNLTRGAHDGAILSEDRRYRYALWRMWNVKLPYINFVMLNPSTADEREDDPTITRQSRRARQLGYGGIVVTNAYAMRATKPEVLKAAARQGVDVVGVPKNAEALAVWARNAGLVIVGWGGHIDEILAGRQAQVLAFLRSAGAKPHALRLNRDGTPAHPLYVGYEAVPLPLEG